MPKSLSLKKVSSNQKAITQFFKNSGPERLKTQPPGISPATSAKRKASSCEPIRDILVLDEYVLGESDKIAAEKHPKKHKKEELILPSDASKPLEDTKTSPQKENGLTTKQNYNISNQKSCEMKKNYVKGFTNVKRIPLSPKKYGNVCENNDILCDIEGELQRKTENSAKSSSSTQISLSPNKSHVAQIEPLRSPRIAKLKTPEKLIQSPSKAKVTLDFGNNVDDPFNDEWDPADVDVKNLVQGILNNKSAQSQSQNQERFDGNQEKSNSPSKLSVTPKKSPLVRTDLRRSPRIAKLMSPDKQVQSPKNVKVSLDFETNVNDIFGDEWDADDIGEVCKEDLDLSILQRCEVMSIEHQVSSSIVRLKNATNNWATCSIEGIWRDTPLCPGECVSVTAGRDRGGRFVVDNGCGALVLRPDHLVSTTSVVAGVFCRRRAVLQDRFRGIDGGNHAMTIGILVHELVQRALLERISDPNRLRKETDRLVKQSTQMLYDSGLSVEETRANMDVYIAPLADFIVTYLSDKPPKLSGQKDKWQGHIDEVLDIEENMCCPQLGLKGKIDATVQVTIHDRKERAVVPLELKSGRASGSAEHRGQIVLYNMMMSAQQDGRLAPRQQSGLLLYLKEKADLREVTSGHPERRDLIMLRNQLVQYLADGPDSPNPEELIDIEEASHLLRQRLPEPIHHHNACAKCPYLTLCSLHLWHTGQEGPQVPATHPLSELRPTALGHLSTEHVTYLLHWSALLRAEERAQVVTSPLRALWTQPPEERGKRGICAANLTLKSVQPSSDRFLHVFERESKEQGDHAKNDHKLDEKGPQEGDFSIVSLSGRPWIAAGVISVVKGREIHIMLERDLSLRLPKDTLFHIDQYQSYATTVQNLTNLGVLMEDSDRSDRLRKLIIDKQLPEFETKLPREVGRLGAKMMKSLNIQQQRAVLKAVAAKDYSLLQGLPGTGKTQTISVMIQMLVALKRRVLVTAHTHSAVDTVLTRLPPSLRIMRLGSGARVAAALRSRCEQHLTRDCNTPEDLQRLYDSMEVVGVTCLGAAHAMLARTSFDVCIVDEATQVLQCTVVRPLLSAQRFVLVGDPDQLPPVVRSRAARRLGMEASLFHRLQSESATCALRLQYRMNARLTRLANDAAYDGRLLCASEQVARALLKINYSKITESYGTESWLAVACSPDEERAALFIHVGGKRAAPKTKGRTCVNADEACVVLALIETLKVGDVAPTDIGVIAPYRDQVALLRRAIDAAVEVSTVDQFQGRDKSVILYSCTRSDDSVEDPVKEGEVLNDQRRLAVSVTRAKHKFIAIGHTRALNKYAAVQRMIDACTTLLLPVDEMEKVLEKYGHTVQ